MRKPGNIARYSLGLALAALTKVTILALVHVALAQARVVTPSWTAATAPPTLHENGKIAFRSDRDGNSEIYVMNPDGSNQVRLTSNFVVDDCPIWSPDGRKIAFVSQKQNGSFAISTMNGDGTGQTEITALNDSNWARWRPLSWSPDGGRIAFHDASAVSGSIDIFVVNIDGSGRHDLTADHAHLDLTPTWSPDGSKILFSRYDVYPPVGYGGTMLHTINVDGTNLTRLVDGFADGWNEDTPDWSPAVNKIVYSVNRWDFVFDLYIANPDGTGRQFFHGCDWTDNSCRFDAFTPAFSPDGTTIAFSMYDFVNNTPQKLYVKNLDGTGLTLLTNNGASPSWQPLLSTACPNPIDCNEIFVRQHYQDFLNREPDPSGLAYWTNRITGCGSDLRCIHERRIAVSAAFFGEMEFQETGYYVERFYKASFGRQPDYAEFTADRAKVIGGSNLEANKQAFADEWVQRSSFVAAYPITMSNTELVNKLFDSAGLTSSLYDPLRQQEILAMNAGRSRALVLRDVIEIADFKNIPDPNDPRYSELKQVSQYNPAFVLMQYFGYLRRDRDQVGYDFWLDVLNNREPNNYRAMVCAFITAREYQLRFGSDVTRSNADCAP